MRQWNKHVFGCLKNNINSASASLQEIHNEISLHDIDDDRHKREIDAYAALDLCLKQQEIFLNEKCRNKWLDTGDRNSSFFHKQLARKKMKRGIFQLQVDGWISDDKQEIANHIISFYQNLF